MIDDKSESRIISLEDWGTEGVQDCGDCHELEDICRLLQCRGPEDLPRALKANPDVKNIQDLYLEMNKYKAPRKGRKFDCLECPTEKKILFCESSWEAVGIPPREAILWSEKHGLFYVTVCEKMTDHGLCSIYTAESRPKICGEGYHCG